ADFVGATVTSEGRSRLLHVREGAVGRIHFGVDRAGLDHVDGDALGPEIARPTAGVFGHGGFRSGVVGYAGPRRRGRGAGAYRNDATTFGHDLRGFAHCRRDAEDVDRELPVHLRG